MDYDDLLGDVNFKAVSRACKILKHFAGTKDADPALRAKFESWLLDRENRIELDIAMRMIFEEGIIAGFNESSK